MTILWGANILQDILQKREPFFADPYRALRKAIDADDECLISAAAVTDIFYVLRKALHSSERAKMYIEQISQILTLADVIGADIRTALTRPMPDFEDAVVDAVAERNGAGCIVTRNGAGCIVTRNTKDFVGSAVPAIMPADLLNGHLHRCIASSIDIVIQKR